MQSSVFTSHTPLVPPSRQIVCVVVGSRLQEDGGHGGREIRSASRGVQQRWRRQIRFLRGHHGGCHRCQPEHQRQVACLVLQVSGITQYNEITAVQRRTNGMDEKNISRIVPQLIRMYSPYRIARSSLSELYRSRMMTACTRSLPLRPCSLSTPYSDPGDGFDRRREGFHRGEHFIRRHAHHHQPHVGRTRYVRGFQGRRRHAHEVRRDRGKVKMQPLIGF